MSGTKFTPGPWRYQENSDAYTHIVRAGDRFITQLGQDTSGQAEADARLIAAAPDLYEALVGLAAEVDGILGIEERSIREMAGNTNVNCLKRRLEQSNAALKKARGEA